MPRVRLTASTVRGLRRVASLADLEFTGDDSAHYTAAEVRDTERGLAWLDQVIADYRRKHGKAGKR